MAKIYRKRDGVEVAIRPSEIKETIMRANNWTEEQYRKQYDIFKNKLRAYENFRRAHGASVETQSPQEVLYKQARTKLREGAAYEPSNEMKRIQSFSAVSITQGKRLAANKESEYSRRRAAQFEATTQQQFKDFIEQNPTAQKIMNDPNITDPVAREEALKKLADEVHAKQTPTGEVIADGETFGSDEPIDDFDYSEFFDKA